MRGILPGEEGRVLTSLTEKDRIRALDALGQALERGIPLLTLADPTGGLPASVCPHVKQAADGTMPLPRALAAAELVDDGEAAVIEAAANAGALAPALVELAAARKDAGAARRALVMGLLYPVALLALASVILPLPRLFSTGFSAYLGVAVWGPLFASALLVFALFVFPRLSPAARRRLAFTLGAVPGLRGLFAAQAEARFLGALARMWKAGVSPRVALDLAGQAAGDRRIVDASGRARRALEGGAGLREALAKAGVVSNESLGAVARGETVGAIDGALKAAADEQSQRAGRRVKVLSLIVVSVVFVGVTGAIAYAVIDGVRSYYQAVEDIIDDG